MSALLLLLSRHDERILHALVLRRRLLLDRVMRSITHLGDAGVVVALALLLVLGAAGPTLQRTGPEVVFALAASHLLVQLLKRTISRPRPRLPVGCASLVEAPDRFSFPSGHATASLALALPVAAAVPLPAAAAILSLALLAGLSRCYLGVHYPGDVGVGWVLAWLAAWAADPVLVWLAG